MRKQKCNKLSDDQFAAMAQLFAVLSESSRLSLLQVLHDGPLHVNELVKVSGLNQANVSKQLAILYNQHLVKRKRHGRFIRYEIASPIVFSLCKLIYNKMNKDTKRTAAVFPSKI